MQDEKNGSRDKKLLQYRFKISYRLNYFIVYSSAKEILV